MAALALLALLIASGPGPEQLPGAPRPLGATTLVGAGEDGRLAVLVQAQRLVVWELETGRVKLTARLPPERWRTLEVAPRTEGESERAAIAADRRLVLVHLRTGRLIGDWKVPAARCPRALTWAPDGRRLALVGWELQGLLAEEAEEGCPVVWVDAETGTVVSQLRLHDPPELRGLAALPEGGLVLGTPRRLIVLGPGPSDARTIGIESDGIVGAAREGIVVRRRGALVVVDPRSGATAVEIARVRGPVEIGASDASDASGDLGAAGVTLRPGGRFAICRQYGAVLAIDLARGRMFVLSSAALGRPFAVVPSLDGLLAIGRRTLRVALAPEAPEELVQRRLCVRGTCRSGDGALVDTVSGRRYTGGFRAGEPSGQGMLSYEDGSTYSGPFVQGQPHGEGTVLTPEGDERRVRAVHGELTPLR